ncbi:GNAT family N-acetyltransferase [bacterium]|nr:GNAT family N-acetyltransferase [bacterium]
MSQASTATKAFEIVPITEVPLDGVLAVLDQIFGPGHDESWFKWKHIDNPFGQSLGWVAIGDNGVLGVRLFMRWRLQYGGREVQAVRPVDTATTASARGKGIFRELTQFAVGWVHNDHQIDLIFNTPNENSRPGYERMGWSILPPIAHGVRPVLPGRIAGIDTTDTAFAAFDQFVPEHGQLTTYRSAEVVKWRYNNRYRVSYERACLRQSEAANGMVYRIVKRRGIRLLVVNELVGKSNERRLLVRSVARHEGALAVVAATGIGALDFIQGPKLKRGRTFLAVRPLRNLEAEVTTLNRWALSLGDLEGTI